METGLEGKPWWHGLLIGVLVVGVALFAANRFMYSPMKREIAGQQGRIADLESQIRRGEAAAAQEEQFEARVQRLREDLDKLLTILPERRDVDKIMDQVQALARQEDLSISRFQPRGEIEREYFNEWPINISLSGTYHNLARFFDRLSRYERIFNVDTLRVNAINDQSPARTISTEFLGKTFIYNDAVIDEGATP